MLQLYVFRRSLVALALCSAAFAASATPASARSHHGAARHAHAHHARRHHSHHHYRHIARTSRWDAGVAQMQARGLAGAQASLAPGAAAGGTATSSGFASSDVVSEARRYIGGNPTGRGSLWCARFMNLVLQRSGHRGTGSDLARSFAGYGQRISGPQVGAIAVMGRRGGGGHVGVVSGIDAMGNPIVV
jgi:CHAP domain